MPEMLPSCLKPSDKGQFGGMKTASTEAKAKRYDELRPGTKIPAEQKAERLDLMRFRDDNGIINRRRATSVGSMTVPATADIWDENGKLKP